MEIQNLTDIFSKIYDSMQGVGYVQNFTSPVLGFLDWLSGYHDFQIQKDKPRKEDLADKIVYFYLEDNEICYLTKDSYDEPKKLDHNLNEDVYNKIRNQIQSGQKDLESLSKHEIYSYLKEEGKIIQGFKYSVNKNIAVPYRAFEDRFEKKYQRIYRAYSYVKNFIRDAGTFTSSETGCRIIALTTSISLAVATGGTFLIAATAAYGIGMGIAVAQQAASRLKLNRLEKEATLIVEYANLYKRKFELTINNDIKSEVIKPIAKDARPSSKISQLWIWTKSSGQYLLTYAVQVVAPIAIGALSPTAAFVQIGLLIASAGITTGVGIYFKKIENDKTHLLNKAIESTKEKGFLPSYKNVRELEEIVRKKRAEVNALELIEINDKIKDIEARKVLLIGRGYKLDKIEAQRQALEEKKAETEEQNKKDLINSKQSYKSFVREYAEALYQVINPFEEKQDVMDHGEVAESVKKLESIIDLSKVKYKETPEFILNDKPKSKENSKKEMLEFDLIDQEISKENSIFNEDIQLMRSKIIRDEAFANQKDLPKLTGVTQAKQNHNHHPILKRIHGTPARPQ